MEELFVYTLTLATIILVACGFRNRKRRSEHNASNNAVDIEEANTHKPDDSDIINKQLFNAELSKAGFRDETIDDMYEKILDMKGKVLPSDAMAIINALDGIMKIRKYNN